jgi:hypothetical protein
MPSFIVRPKEKSEDPNDCFERNSTPRRPELTVLILDVNPLKTETISIKGRENHSAQNSHHSHGLTYQSFCKTHVSHGNVVLSSITETNSRGLDAFKENVSLISICLGPMTESDPGSRPDRGAQPNPGWWVPVAQRHIKEVGSRGTWYEVHLRRHRPHRQTIILSREGVLPATGSPLPSPSPLDVTPTLPPDFTASSSPTPTPRPICLPPPRPTVSYLEATGSILLAAERGEESKFTSVASHLRFNQRSP